MITCARCNRVAPVDPDDLMGGGGDPSLLVVLVPPPGWLGDPDGDGILCRGCATAAELAEWDAVLAEGERIIAEIVEADGGPRAGPADPFDDDELDD